MPTTPQLIPAVNAFLLHLKIVKQASEHTVRNYAIDLSHFKRHLEIHLLSLSEENVSPSFSEKENIKQGPEISLSQINRKNIRHFLACQIEQGTAKRSAVRRLSSLRSFFKFCILQGLLQENPAEQVDAPKLEKKIPLFLSYEQVKRLIELPDTKDFLGFRDRTILELFYSSGLRVSELVALNRADFYPQELTILVRGKGKKERKLPITKNATDWIKEYLAHVERFQEGIFHVPEQDHEAIFLNREGTRLSVRSVDRLLEKYWKASGIAGKVTPHTIRHTIATHWLENGMDLKMIQLLLRHSSPSTTALYAKVSTRLKKEVYDKTHPRA